VERHSRSFKGFLSFALSVCGCFATSPVLWLLLTAVLFALPILVPLWLFRKFVVWSVRKICKHTLPEIIQKPLKQVDNFCRRWLHYFVMARQIWIIKYFLATSASLYRALRERNAKPDLVYCNDLDTLLAGVVWKWKYGAKLVYDAHEFWAHV